MRVLWVIVAVALLALVSLPASSSSSSFLASSVAGLSSSLSSFARYLSTSGVYHPTPADAHSFLGHDLSLRGSAHIVDVQQRLVFALQKLVARWKKTAAALGATASVSAQAEEYPYFRMIPEYIVSVIPGAPAVSFSSPCFADTSAVADDNGDGSLTLTFTLAGATSLLCLDSYLLGTVEGYQTLSFNCLLWSCGGTKTVQWTPAEDVTAAELFDIGNKGVRVFRFIDDPVTTAWELEKTVELFVPLTSQTVSDSAAAANIDFLAKYANVSVHERAVQSVPLDESLIHSGDFFGVMRLDGLDPMLAWAMGAHTGHTVLALRILGQLFIVEVTNKNAYWPTNGVQAHPYALWMQMAQQADYNVVWAPLTPAARAAFDEAAAIKYFLSQVGFDYGYQTLLWGWQDTVQDNYPCLPPNRSLCLTPHHVQILFGFLNRSLPDTGNVLFLQAFNHRLGTEQLSFAELLQYANETAGVSAEELPTIVERDSWLYDTTRFNVSAQGPAQVCCVFVCNMWRAGGLFGNLSSRIQCAEQTNYDDYSLDFLTVPQPKPAQCSQADQDNVLCQLEGKYSLQLQDYGSKPVYPNMHERCPSEAPSYSRPGDC